MPWAPDDGPARHTKKAKSPKAKRQWADAANAVLERIGDEGQAVRRGKRRRQKAQGARPRQISGKEE